MPSSISEREFMTNTTIKQFPIDKPFNIPFDGVIRGYGEIYEMISVERIRRKMLKRYGSKVKFYLMEELTLHFIDEDRFIEVGEVDNPPWKCLPRSIGNYKRINPLFMALSVAIFKVMVLFESPIWSRFYKPHLYYCVMKND